MSRKRQEDNEGRNLLKRTVKIKESMKNWNKKIKGRRNERIKENVEEKERRRKN